MRANGKRAGEWPDAEYHARKARERRQGAESGKSGTTRPRTKDTPSETLKMDLTGTTEMKGKHSD